MARLHMPEAALCLAASPCDVWHVQCEAAGEQPNTDQEFEWDIEDGGDAVTPSQCFHRHAQVTVLDGALRLSHLQGRQALPLQGVRGR